MMQTTYEFRMPDESKSPEVGLNAATAAQEALRAVQAQAVINAHTTVAAAQAEVNVLRGYTHTVVNTKLCMLREIRFVYDTPKVFEFD